MQYFFDSPTHLGHIEWRQWTETHDGRTQTWRVALDDPTAAQAIDAYARRRAARSCTKKARCSANFRQFDYGTYTFVACYRTDCGGDGMEHRNSTSVTGRSMDGDGTRGLSTLAHEYFHSWNVKRIRPQGIEPFDYEPRQHDRRAVDRRRLHAVLRPAARERAGVEPAANDRAHRRRHHQRRHQLAGPAVLRADRHEPAGAVPRRRRRGRCARSQHLHLLLHLRRRDRDRARLLPPGPRQVAR